MQHPGGSILCRHAHLVVHTGACRSLLLPVRHSGERGHLQGGTFASGTQCPQIETADRQATRPPGQHRTFCMSRMVNLGAVFRIYNTAFRIITYSLITSTRSANAYLDGGIWECTFDPTKLSAEAALVRDSATLFARLTGDR